MARFVESWAAGDVEGVMACVTETFIYRASIGPEPGKTYSGAEGVRAGIAEMRAIDAGRIPVVCSIARMHIGRFGSIQQCPRCGI